MSANNQLLIIKNNKNLFEVHENLCVDNDFIPDKTSLLSTHKLLTEAIKPENSP